MLTVVFDAAPLITACKFEGQGVLVIDHLLPACWIVIAPRVEEVILRTIRACYRAGVIEHSVARLQEVKQRAESRGAGEGGDSTGSGAPQGSGGP